MDTPITVRLVNAKGEGLQVANVLVDVRFYMEGRYRYGFSLGRTEADGVLHTSLANIEAQLAEERTHFLMDYNTPLAECDDAIGVYVPPSDELGQREVTRSKWWPDDQPLATNSNGTIACGEQRFTLRRGGQNDFALVCERA